MSGVEGNSPRVRLGGTRGHSLTRENAPLFCAATGGEPQRPLLRSAPSSCYDETIIEKVRTLPMILSEAIQSLMDLQAKLAAYGHAMFL